MTLQIHIYEGNRNFQRFPQCLQIQFHVQPRTLSCHRMKPPVNSPGSSAMFITYSLSGHQRGWRAMEVSEVQRQAEGQCMGRRHSKRRRVHTWTHLVRRKMLPHNCGRTQTDCGLVAVEELDLKESTVDLGLHPASSRRLSPAGWRLVQKHPNTQHWKH